MSMKPDILCIGCSCPINWERSFALTAKARDIPVVAIADIWGAVGRLGDMRPDHALVIDEQEVKQLKEQGISASVIGDIASRTSTASPRETAAVERFKNLQHTFKTVLLVGDHNDVVSELASLTAACLKQEDYPRSFVVIPRLVHPKQTGDPDVQHLLATALKELDGLTVDSCPGWSTDALAARCDYTIGCFTTPLRIAVHNNMHALSFHGPLCRELLKTETGLDTYPLVSYGVVPPVIIPCALSAFNWGFFGGKARQWAHATRFQPDAALAQLSAIVA